MTTSETTSIKKLWVQFQLLVHNPETNFNFHSAAVKCQVKLGNSTFSNQETQVQHKPIVWFKLKIYNLSPDLIFQVSDFQKLYKLKNEFNQIPPFQ